MLHRLRQFGKILPGAQRPTKNEARHKERFYEGIAADFETIMNRYDLERRLARMLQCLPGDLHGRTALDGGCGPGFFSRNLADRGAKVVAVDISSSLAAQARKRSGALGLCCDIARLPFADGVFDIVLSSECIEHTVDPSASFASLARVLKPGGTLVLSVPNRRWYFSLQLATLARLRPYAGLENWVHPTELRRWAKRAGLRVSRHFGVHPLPFQLPLAAHWLPALESALRPLDLWMINQVIVASKPH